jgi:hypothetical protein
MRQTVGDHEKSALPRPLANADAGLDMSLNRYFQGKPVFFVVPCTENAADTNLVAVVRAS